MYILVTLWVYRATMQQSEHDLALHVVHLPVAMRTHTGPSRVQEVFDALCAQDAIEGTQDTGERTRGLKKL